MRVLLVCLVVSLCVMAASAALTCFGDEEKCGADECCIQAGNTFVGLCRPRHDVGKLCEMKPINNLIKKYVYKVMCPCKEGLSCVSSKGGILGKFVGKCQEGSGEVTEEE